VHNYIPHYFQSSGLITPVPLFNTCIYIIAIFNDLCSNNFCTVSFISQNPIIVQDCQDFNKRMYLTVWFIELTAKNTPPKSVFRRNRGIFEFHKFAFRTDAVTEFFHVYVRKFGSKIEDLRGIIYPQ